VQALVGDFDSFAEAFVSLVDQQTPSEWWHIVNTDSGEVVERRHLKVHNGMIGFERSDWLVGSSEAQEPASPPALPIASPKPRGPNLSTLEADLRSAVASGITKGAAKGSNGTAADH
jgi:hypothetical protein